MGVRVIIGERFKTTAADSFGGRLSCNVGSDDRVFGRLVFAASERRNEALERVRMSCVDDG